MFVRFRLLGFCMVLTCSGWAAQTAHHAPASSSVLQQHYDAAQAAQRAGDLNEAAAQYRNFLADALSELAREYTLVPDYSRSSTLFDDALVMEPHSPSLLLDYAHEALAAGDFEHARTLGTKLMGIGIQDRSLLAQAHQILGRALLKLNRDREARTELETAVALDPTFANGYDLAVACLDLDDEKCAAQIFGEMEKSFGDTAEIHLAFGRAYGDS